MDSIQVMAMISNRHCHLTQEDFETLFGKDGQLTVKKMMGKTEFAANECVSIVGARGRMDGIRILSPLRRYTQVELFRGDCRQLGIKAPIVDSGNLDDAGEIEIIGPKGSIKKKAAIIALRHVHLTPAKAEELQLKDKDWVSVKVGGERGLTFDNVLVRVQPGDFTPVIHFDVEEGNAACVNNGDMLEVIKA